MTSEFKHWYLYIRDDDIRVERKQCEDEGKNVSPLSEAFESVLSLDLEKFENQPKAMELLDKTTELPIRTDYPYKEPSDLEGIRCEAAGVEKVSLPTLTLGKDALFDKVYGAWLGRVCGCLLGKPVEGWEHHRQWGMLKDSGRYPLSDYFSINIPKEIIEKYNVNKEAPFIENVRCMPVDDDTNYTVIGLEIMKKHGADFTPCDIATYWMGNIPINQTATAERLAYRNLSLLIPPPQSATFRNPYREWIGAQIRADFFGYACPGNPSRAAALAWRDASISHIKNGIYGEMWAAAMIAAAFVTNDIPTIIKAGLSQIPERCRLAEYINKVFKWREDDLPYEKTLERIHRLWDEKFSHDLVHVISNAMIVAIGLLWGENDFEKTLCRAVQAAFDTDCNGATVGSIIGAILGSKNIPQKWTAPLNDTLKTSLSERGEVKISQLARETIDVIEKIGE